MSSFLKILFALLLLSLHVAGSILGFNRATNSGEVKCLERERHALLNFKQGLVDVSGMLSSWRDDDNNGDCCKWKGIACSNETGNVQMLHLRGSDIHSLTGIINITSLIELQDMEYIDLSWNDFRQSQIPELMGSFGNLRYLNLSYSNFDGKIPYQLGDLKQLQDLDLGGNDYLVGAIPYQLGNLTKLRYLNLDGSSLVGAIPHQLANLTQLQYLNLQGNYLVGAIPHQLANLTQLQYLNLQGNYLVGAIPFHTGDLPLLQSLRLGDNSDLKINKENHADAEWLSNLSHLTNLHLSLLNLSHSHHWLPIISKLLPNLRELNLNGCGLSDVDVVSLFDSHSNISSSLTILHLSSNMLTSSTFQWLFNFTFNLQELYLSDNNFVLSSPTYLNFPSLVILDFSYNNPTSSVFQGNWNFSSKLQELYLRGCSLADRSFLLPFDSIYLNFPSLVILDLSYSNLTSFGFQGNWNFSSKLQKLYLQNCSLSDRSFLLPSASNMKLSSSLVFLDLSYNLLKSSAVFHWLFNFTTSLHELRLSGNLLEGSIPEDFGNIMNSLEDLDLSDNKLQGKIPTSFRNISTLKTLSLSNNRITGMLPDLSTLPSLIALGLSYNQLIGEIPKSIGLLSELESLSLGGNSLEGDVTESHLTNLSKLTYLFLSDNPLSLKFGISWVPPFQLRYLDLASCKLGPSFPNWLQTQSRLSFLDISNNGITDSVPEWLWRKLQLMEKIDMSHNNLTGTIPNLSLTLTPGATIILNSNQFEGVVPSFLLQASALILSKNKFSSLDSFLCGIQATANLAALDLSNNRIKGQLPDCWEPLHLLLFLDLSNNNLSGKIPLSVGTLDKLEALVLRNNSLIGELPSTLRNCSNLFLLDVGENLLSGPIPSWIGESMQQLIILSMPGNRFSGNLPLHLCYLRRIQVLDLSRNNLSNGIPTCLKNFTAMVEKSINESETNNHIYWYNITFRQIYGTYSISYELDILLMWKGAKYEFKDPETRLKSIDLSSNHLTGEIPTEFGQLLGLVSLNLSRNKLRGEIPSEFGNLSSLEFLDLSRNYLSGKIPSTLSQIDRVEILNLSNNFLSGRIPSGRQLQTLEASNFEGNLYLCGIPLDNCPEDEIPFQHQEPGAHETDESSAFYEALYMSLGLGYFTGLWGLLGPILVWRRWRNAYVRFLNKMIDYIYVIMAVNAAKWHRWRKG